MSRIVWTDDMLDRAEAIFRSHTDLAAAFAEVRRTVADVTESAIASKLARAGKQSPSRLLRAPLSVPVATVADVPRPPAMPTDVMLPRSETVRSAHEPSSNLGGFKPGILVAFPDAHHPDVDEDAWNLALRVARFTEADELLVLGDFGDFAAVSSHSKGPDKLAAFAEELRLTNAALDQLDALKIEKRHFIEGNHETRAQRCIMNNAPAFHELPCLSVPSLLNLQSRGWTFSPYMQTHMIGTLSVSHDFGDAGPYAAKRSLEAVDGDTLFGHTHRLMQHQGVSRRTGEIITATSGGWLGNFSKITYTHQAKARRDWGHGMCVGYKRADGSVRVEMVRFVNGTAKVDGQRV